MYQSRSWQWGIHKHDVSTRVSMSANNAVKMNTWTMLQYVSSGFIHVVDRMDDVMTSQILHGAGIFTDIDPWNDPVWPSYVCKYAMHGVSGLADSYQIFIPQEVPCWSSPMTQLFWVIFLPTKAVDSSLNKTLPYYADSNLVWSTTEIPRKITIEHRCFN